MHRLYPNPWRQQLRWWPPVRPPSVSSCQPHICHRSSLTSPTCRLALCSPPPTALETWATLCCQPHTLRRSVCQWWRRMDEFGCLFLLDCLTLLILTAPPACICDFDQQLHLLNSHSHTDSSQAFTQWVSRAPHAMLLHVFQLHKTKDFINPLVTFCMCFITVYQHLKQLQGRENPATAHGHSVWNCMFLSICLHSLKMAHIKGAICFSCYIWQALS